MMVDNELIHTAARLLVAARRSGDLLDGLPENCRPKSALQAHSIQDATIALLQAETGAYKVNAFPQGGHIRGIVTKDRVLRSPARLEKTRGLAGLEPEIAFRFPGGVLPRDPPHRRDDLAPLAEAVPAFDVVESRYTDFMGRTQFERAADCLSAGWLVIGDAMTGWQDRDFAAPRLTITRNGGTVFSNTGRHPFGDPFMPVVHWLNARRGEGCPPGAIVTTGSYAGLIDLAPGDVVDACFEGFSPIRLELSR